MSRTRRWLVRLWAVAGVLASPWAAEWLIRRHHGPRPHLGAPSIRLPTHHTRRNHP